ncbi:ankyrin repeat domain-containing protein [Anatilimnocola floriformis]|uniref:ankyrin repeat domain-containing protein n=1 Tax=Anatilimnocola floriformis TaxID=2948575 RepID=UPI0020C2E791|nr:ankyrin repeat domain-containing protein [Anatilimnocola floriformis]
MTDETPVPERMYNAIQEGDLLTFKSLFELHPEQRHLPDGRSMWFSDAASAGNLDVIKFLISTGVDINEPANSDSVASPEGVVYRAAADGHLEVVRWMLDQGAKINFNVHGKTRCYALIHAAREGNLPMVQLLLEKGAATNSCWAEMTPLDHAIDSGSDEVIQILRSNGAKQAKEL